MSVEQHHTNDVNAVNFLQQEHAKTLKGLHTEIHKLQQKCARLTFELTMVGGNLTPNQETSLIEEELTKSQEQLASLNSQVSLHKEKILLLEHEVQRLRKETRDLQREKQDIIRTTQYQLEEKSTTIAHLVSKLQQSQFLLQKVQTATGTHITPSLYPPTQIPHPPPTPSADRPQGGHTGHITRRLRRAITSPHTMPSSLANVSHPPEYNTAVNSAVINPSITSTNNKSLLITPCTPPERKNRDQLLLEQVRQPQLLQRALAMKKLPPTPSNTIQRTLPVLPPIQSEESMGDSSSTVHHSIHPPNYHRGKRYTTIKGGLNSAPCSLRLMNYSTAPNSRSLKEESGEDESGEEEEEEQERETAEGMLLIKHQLHQGNPLYFKSQRKS